jgi:predicted transcriptional regulator
MRQADLARAAGISPSYLNLIEHNRRRIAGGVLARIAGALEVPVDALTGRAEGGLVDALREAAADAGPGTAPEIDRADDFAGRFPGWAALVADQQRRLTQMNRALEDLSERMSHDPHLSAALHEVLSAAASVRSTAAILADTPDIEEEWRTRFERNLADDSARLATGAEALVAYLDGAAARETGIAAPQEELEAWLAARDWCLPETEPDAPPADPASLIAGAAELASRPARIMAADWLAQARADAAALPARSLAAALAEDGPDPARLARRFGAEPPAVFRRLAALPPEAGPIGLVVCDGSGTLVFRKPLAGFSLPRFGAACPLWPLYRALSRPGLPIRTAVSMPGPGSPAFMTYALALWRPPADFDAPPVLHAYMLILPCPPDERPAAQPVGTACRICPRADCPARREPAIVAETA